MIYEPKLRVYDIECLYNFFCVTFRVAEKDSNEKHVFRIGGRLRGIQYENDTEKLREFVLNECTGLIGFNNVNYDWPVLNWILLTHRKLASLDGDDAARLIHEKSIEILSRQRTMIYNPAVPQLDLFRLHHFDNKNKAVSLKALQIAMNWPLVADMPVNHNEFSSGEEWCDKVEEYNDNDVLSTKEFYHRSSKDIALRKKTGEIYGIDMINFNEAKMGEQIILHRVAKARSMTVDTLKGLYTRRNTVALNDCILPVSFQTKEFQKALDVFNSKVIDTRIREEWEEKEEKEKEEMYSCIYDDVRYDFGLGGLHGLRAPGVYREDDEYVILSVDVSSYYPYLAIQNRFYPEHLGDTYCDTLLGMYKERKAYPKGSLEDKGLKISLVAPFGKTRSQYSPLYDPRYFYQIVINGQLQLAKLAELITLAGGHVIMANTDGLEIRVKRNLLEEVENQCSWWSASTKLILESKRYKALYIRDVNNYVGDLGDGKSYVKGAYEYDDIGWHKDHSMLCVPEAAVAYLTKGTPIMETLKAAPLDKFYIGKRAKSGGKFEIRTVTNSKEIPEDIPAFLLSRGWEQNGTRWLRTEWIKRGEVFMRGGMTEDEAFAEAMKWEEAVQTRYLSKTVRYVITKTGGYLLKKEESAKKPSQIDAPFRITECMDMRTKSKEKLRERIDYRYYETEVKRLLDPLLKVQTRLL